MATDEVAKAERDYIALIATADEVMAAKDGGIPAALEEMVAIDAGTIELADRTYSLFEVYETSEAAAGPARWHVSLAAGVLQVSLWRDSQDRERETPKTVLMLGPGAWISFMGAVEYLVDTPEGGTTSEED